MFALSLFLVLAAVKTAVLGILRIAVPWWQYPLFFFEDAALVFLLAALEQGIRHRRVVGGIYGAIILYTAINLPVMLLFASPLTRPMLRAAGGALTDSIAHYLTWRNGLGCLTVLVVGTLLPHRNGFLDRMTQRFSAGWGIARDPALAPDPERGLGWTQRAGRLVIPAGLLVVAGLFWFGSQRLIGRVESAGVHRNAVLALVRADFTAARTLVTDQSDVRQGIAGPDNRAGLGLTCFRGRASDYNIVVIALESTSALYLKTFGGRYDLMPAVARLAREAVLFSQAYAVYPESIKGLYSVLCARYPALARDANEYASDTTPSLADRLRAAGYRTALFHSGRFDYLGMEAIIRHRGFDTLEDAGDIGGNHQSSFGIDEPATVNRLLAWIDQVPRTNRFFAWYLPIAGHHPYETPEPGPFRENSEFGRYLNALQYSDAAVAQLVAGLQARGRYTNTLFVLYGDHGEAFGQHPGNFGHTMFLYEENVRVPLLFVLPGLGEPVHSPAPASLIDLAPTLVDLLGLPPEPRHEGASLLVDDQRNSLFFTDYSSPLLGLRDGPWKFIHDLESGRDRLYDLAVDPAEQRNLATKHRDLTRQFRQRLRQWHARYLMKSRGVESRGSTAR